MSASIKYSEGETARLWNSSFHIVHAFIKSKASSEPVARRILEENPIAGELKFLNLETLKRSELASFIEVLDSLKAEAPTLALTWNQPEYIKQFTFDLSEATIRANKALLATDGAS
jgi:hypothetical protein